MAESEYFTELLTPALELIFGKGGVTGALVRKLGHYGEYALLGLEMGIYMNLLIKQLTYWYPRRKGFAICMGCAFAAAFIDETIQIFSGRGPAIVDVWIDLAGAASSLLPVSVYSYFIARIRNRENI